MARQERLGFNRGHEPQGLAEAINQVVQGFERDGFLLEAAAIQDKGPGVLLLHSAEEVAHEKTLSDAGTAMQ